MGLMDQFTQRQQQQHQGSQLSSMLMAARQLAGNDPRAALQRMVDNGMTCNLPDGRTLPVSDLLSMAEGKTPQEFLSALGIK